MGKPRLPWKRGPAAWKIACDSEEIKGQLRAQPRKYLSLRMTAKIFGISTQPIRDWLRLGYLKRQGPRRQITLGELERFVGWLAHRAKPFPSEKYTERFIGKSGFYSEPFQTLANSRFVWPKGRKELTPQELAELVGCHPSLITKAIHACKSSWARLGRRKTPKRQKLTWYWYGSQSDRAACRCHWEISRRAWENVFPGTIIAPRRTPALPRTEMFTTEEAAHYLGAWGVRDVSAYEVRQMIHEGLLVAVRPTARKRKWFVTRKSLEIFRKKLLTASQAPNFVHDTCKGG